MSFTVIALLFDGNEGRLKLISNFCQSHWTGSKNLNWIYSCCLSSSFWLVSPFNMEHSFVLSIAELFVLDFLLPSFLLFQGISNKSTILSYKDKDGVPPVRESTIILTKFEVIVHKHSPPSKRSAIVGNDIPLLLSFGKMLNWLRLKVTPKLTNDLECFRKPERTFQITRKILTLLYNKNEW